MWDWCSSVPVTTDVVQKEMYTFEDKGGRSITLRPEGTAGVIRAFIENGLSSKTLPLKVHYSMPMFRYENAQKGRYREFNQIGAEVIGTASYVADVEIISMANEFLKKLNLSFLILNFLYSSYTSVTASSAFGNFTKRSP